MFLFNIYSTEGEYKFGSILNMWLKSSFILSLLGVDVVFEGSTRYFTE